MALRATSITSAGQITGNLPSSQVAGTTTNNNAPAGNIGELVLSTVASGSAVALTTGVVSNVTSISLTAGDWDVSGVVDFTFGATTNYTQIIAGISNSTGATVGQPGNAVVGADPNNTIANSGGVVPGGAAVNLLIPVTRVTLASTTTIFLVTQAVFTVSTLSVFGTIRARRVR